MRQIKLHGLAICVVTGSGQPSLLNKLVDEGANLVCRNMNEALTAFLAICHATGIAPVQ